MFPAIIPIVLAAAAVATTGYSIHASNMASKRMSTIAGQQADTQAKQMEADALAEKTRATQEEVERQRTLKRIIASQNTLFGSSGAAMGSTTFAGIQRADAARAAESTRLNQVFSDLRQMSYAGSIANVRTQAQIDRIAAKYQRRANTISGIGSMLQQTSNVASGYNQYKLNTQMQ